MENDLAKINRNLGLLKAYAVMVTVLFIILIGSGFAQSTVKRTLDEITANRINILDSTGRLESSWPGHFQSRALNSRD